jgi:hypothetical protein
MVFDYTPQQGYIAAESKDLADADFTEPGQDTGEDHSAHVTGKTCARCGHPITVREAARLRGESDWVHDVCPAID